MVAWLLGCLAAWLLGQRLLRQCLLGCLAAWSMAAWLLGCLTAWLLGCWLLGCLVNGCLVAWLLGQLLLEVVEGKLTFSDPLDHVGCGSLCQVCHAAA